ncbi:PREDICTED: ubiquitin-conjugating enzyme E2 U [Thamnophis sirtalis]|uniref:Ubiquitin-conjugating enzyme E2 U n=1 Tax=Thamnophis sirtalis TaxID=35019 RepID=A0A6I9Z0L8_9SAUR|nr:PREDICTED: ubiquitin-conjugating enzyme E2 U [Thamnophis sirtalis]
MLHSRAFLLLEKEFVELKQANIFGINVMAIEDNWMEWIAEIEGLKDTLWEGAELQLSLKYSEDYNSMPPTITFTTIPFHPNVDPESGRPCVDFLDNFSKWNTRFTMTSILLTIQVLLSNPVLDNAVNLEAAQMLKNNYPLYREKVVQCVINSKQLEAIAKDWDTSVKFYPGPKEPAPHRTRAISYEEYFITWFKIATSRPAEDFKHPVFDDPEYIGNRYNWMAENVNRGSWDEILHNIIVSDCIEKQKKQIMLENLGGKCVIPDSEAPSKESSVGSKKMEKSKNEEHWEDEVEGLVMWSTKLDQAKLD